MDIIYILALADILEQRVVLDDVQCVPADLRHLQALVRQVRLQRAHLALDKSQARVFAVLIAFFKQQLHAQADAQQRLFFRLGPDDRHKAGGHQLVHGVAKGTHAGQDEPVGFADGIGVGGDHRVLPQLCKAGFQAEQVAHAVIHDRDHTSSPFVEGISSLWASSIFTAAPSACPAPLKQASRMW